MHESISEFGHKRPRSDRGLISGEHLGEHLAAEIAAAGWAPTHSPRCSHGFSDQPPRAIDRLEVRLPGSPPAWKSACLGDRLFGLRMRRVADTSESRTARSWPSGLDRSPGLEVVRIGNEVWVIGGAGSQLPGRPVHRSSRTVREHCRAPCSWTVRSHRPPPPPRQCSGRSAPTRSPRH
jgi:hypothetical protein